MNAESRCAYVGRLSPDLAALDLERLALMRGEADRASLKGASKEVCESITEEQLGNLVATSHENLPDMLDEDD